VRLCECVMCAVCIRLLSGYRPFSLNIRSYVFVFVYPYIPQPFSLPPFPLPLPFSVKNMVTETGEVVSRPFPFVFIPSQGSVHTSDSITLRPSLASAKGSRPRETSVSPEAPLFNGGHTSGSPEALASLRSNPD
jgi:hypothetical protein